MRTRDDTVLHHSVREILRKMNFTVVEAPDSDYCGIWKYSEPDPVYFEYAPHVMHQIYENDIEVLNNEEKLQKMQERVSMYTTEKAAVYCNGCEKGMRLGGGNPVHMIELCAENLVNVLL